MAFLTCGARSFVAGFSPKLHDYSLKFNFVPLLCHMRDRCFRHVSHDVTHRKSLIAKRKTAFCVRCDSLSRVYLVIGKYVPCTEYDNTGYIQRIGNKKVCIYYYLIDLTLLSLKYININKNSNLSGDRCCDRRCDSSRCQDDTTVSC